MAVGVPVEELSDMSHDSSASSSFSHSDQLPPPLTLRHSSLPSKPTLAVGAIRKISLRANPKIYNSYGIYFKECNFDLKVRGQKLAVKFYVDNVVDDSEAQLAGIIKGDVILELTCTKLRTERERKGSLSSSSRSVRRRKSMSNNDQAMACDPAVYDPNYNCNNVLSNDKFVVHGIDVREFESFLCTMPSIIIDVIYIKADEWSSLSDKKTRLERDYREKKLKIENHDRHIQEIEKGILRPTTSEHDQSSYSDSSKRISGSSTLKDKLFKRNSMKYSSRSMSQPDLLASDGLQTLPRKGKAKKDSAGSQHSSYRDASTPRVMERSDKKQLKNKSLKSIHSYFTGPSSSSSGYGTVGSRSSNGSGGAPGTDNDDDTLSQCSSVRSSGGSITPTNSFNFSSGKKSSFSRRPLLSAAVGQDTFVPSHRFNPNHTAPPFLVGPGGGAVHSHKLDADFCQNTLPRNFKHKTNLDSSRLGLNGPKELPGRSFHFASNVKTSNFASSSSHATFSSSLLRSSTPKRGVEDTSPSACNESASPAPAVTSPGVIVRSSPPSIVRLNSTGHDQPLLNGAMSSHQFVDINEEVNHHHFSNASSDCEKVSNTVVPVNEDHIQSYSSIESSAGGHRPITLSVGPVTSDEDQRSNNSGGSRANLAFGSSETECDQEHPSVHTPVMNLPKQTPRLFYETQL